MPGAPANLNDAGCSPRPTAIQVPKDPLYTLTFPSYVILHRCTGSCVAHQNTHHCTVTHRNEMSIKVEKIIPGYYVGSVKVYNHTKCGCDCIKKESDCDLAKHVWNKDSCSCLCKHDGSLQCDMQIYRWNTATCECDCINPPTHCEYKKAWDQKKCGCYCKQVYQGNCQSQNMNIDPNTCNCVNSSIKAF